MSERKTVSVRMSPELYKKIRFLAIERERSVAELLEEAIQDLLKKHKKK
ncbi:MAG: ribbon-helix-helix domain-containing protein [bacterium]